MKKIIIGLFTIGFLLVYGSTFPIITSMPSDNKIGSNGKTVIVRGVIGVATLDSQIEFKDDSGGVIFLTKSKIGSKIFSACGSKDYCEITGVINDYGVFTSISNVKKIQDDSITVSDKYYGAGIYMRDYTIRGGGEECIVTYNSSDNKPLSYSTCLSLTNSKGIKIYCTKNRKICKTEQEIINKIPTILFYESSDGTKYETTFNKHGAVMKSKSKILYLGKSCDVESQELGKGTWSWHDAGFKIVFENTKIWFGEYQWLQIDNNNGCSGMVDSPVKTKERRGINKELNLCVLYPNPKELYTTSLALGNIANDNDIKINGDKIIITAYDIRGKKLADIIVQQVNFTSRPSCHKLWGIYIYRSDSYIKNTDYFFQTLYEIFGFENVNGEEEPLDPKDILN